ncbi:MAG TPA: alpha-D-ribose 1-methylphosphonate 5-triphosphate diphosphatase [Bordetella sp.]
MSATYITNARVVLPDTLLENGAVLIEDGVIAAIEPAGSHRAQVVDLQGQWLMPGLVDLHCDAIEKEAEPRSRVLFPLDFALAQVDRRNAIAGITTPYHALSFSNKEWGVRNNATAAELARGIHAFRRQGLVDNRVHLRYEVTDAGALPIIESLIDDEAVDLISVMDHSPGQGQFKTLEAYLQYMMGNHGLDRAQAEEAAQMKLNNGEGALARVERLIAHAQRAGVATASHDDDSVQRIATMRNLGVAISEFPINLDTAKAAVSCGLSTILGAPNVLRGGSQSGSMRAIDGIIAGVTSCLCSDYQPSTLIAAVFTVLEQSGLTMPQAAALVTANPARAAGLADRGRIQAGLRADLTAVTRLGRLPLVSHVWSAGRLVCATHYPVTREEAVTA